MSFGLTRRQNPEGRGFLPRQLLISLESITRARGLLPLAGRKCWAFWEPENLPTLWLFNSPNEKM